MLKNNNLDNGNGSGGTVGTGGTSNIDIVIDDAEFLFAESVLCTYLENLTMACQHLSALCMKATMFAVRDQAISSSLLSIRADLNSVEKLLEIFKSGMPGTASGFISRIDSIDKFIY